VREENVSADASEDHAAATESVCAEIRTYHRG
jgi:hypothetical protein